MMTDIDIYEVVDEYVNHLISIIGMYDLWDEFMAVNEDEDAFKDFLFMDVRPDEVEEEYPGLMEEVTWEIIHQLDHWSCYNA